MPGGLNTNGSIKQMYDRMSAENAKTAQPESTFNMADGGVLHQPEPVRGFEKVYFADGGHYSKGSLHGGRVVGKGGPVDDQVPAAYSAGEYVLPTDTAQAIGYDKLDEIRAATHTPAAMQARGFKARMADGGTLYPYNQPDKDIYAGLGKPGSAPENTPLPGAITGGTAPGATAVQVQPQTADALPTPVPVATPGTARSVAPMAGGQQSAAGAGRGTASDPRTLGNPGTIAAQARGFARAQPEQPEQPRTAPSLNNPNALNNVVGRAVEGAPGVVKLQGGMFKNPMYTDDPVRAANEFNHIGIVPGGARAAMDGPPASGVRPGSATPSAGSDSALLAARMAAADRGDFSAVRDSYFAQGQSFGGETKDSVASDRLKELALSPEGTPGRKAALQMYKDKMDADTTLRGQDIVAGSARYTADAHVKSQQATNSIAQGKLQIDQAKDQRIAKLDELIISGNPMQQKMAAAQKAALMGKGWGTAADQKTAQEGALQAKDTQDIFSIIDQAEPLLGSATGSYAGAAIDKVGQVFGHATDGAKTGAQLQALQGALVAKMPKMSGPQSDKDVQLYREMAGQIGNATIPGEQRQAALNTIRQLHEKYLPMVTNETDAAKLAPGTTFKGPDGKIRRIAS